MTTDNSPVQRLLAIGFSDCGEWLLQGDSLILSLIAHERARNILYAFHSGERVLYIGKSVRTLQQRLYGYVRPGPTQFTNLRGREHLIGMLHDGLTVRILALPDNGLLRYGGFHVNLAAGLEDSLIRDLRPEWNRSGK